VIYFVTVNYNSSEFIVQLIRSIQASRNICYQVVVVNNSPEDPSLFHLKTDNIFILEAGENLGFGSACNLGLNWIYSQDTEAIVWIINPDTYFLDDALEKVPKFLATHPHLSIVGTMVYTPSGEVWFAGGKFMPKTGAILSETIGLDNPDVPYLETDWVSGCSLLIKLKNFPECPQFNRDYFLYYEDFDFCRRYANEGHLIAITNQLGVIHQVSAITNKNIASKFKHSTFSYLLTLKQYTNQWVLIGWLTRILLHGFLLILVKPQVAFGKLHGVWLYLRRSLEPC
jgi:N-acetylglucosaminyl-diphospho-decaprenol L-rhamnosyltransferase